MISWSVSHVSLKWKWVIFHLASYVAQGEQPSLALMTPSRYLLLQFGKGLAWSSKSHASHVSERDARLWWRRTACSTTHLLQEGQRKSFFQIFRFRTSSVHYLSRQRHSLHCYRLHKLLFLKSLISESVIGYTMCRRQNIPEGVRSIPNSCQLANWYKCVYAPQFCHAMSVLDWLMFTKWQKLHTTWSCRLTPNTHKSVLKIRVCDKLYLISNFDIRVCDNLYFVSKSDIRAPS